MGPMPLFRCPSATNSKKLNERASAPAAPMEYIPNILLVGPATRPFSLGVFVVSLAISSFWFRRVDWVEGIGIYLYAIVTALIVVPFLLFVGYLFYTAPLLGTFSHGVLMLSLSLLMTPLTAGWLFGFLYGGVLRWARRKPTVQS